MHNFDTCPEFDLEIHLQTIQQMNEELNDPEIAEELRRISFECYLEQNGLPVFTKKSIEY